MEKTRNLLLAILICSIFLISAVSAEVFLEQPDAIYNLGDEITIEASVDELTEGYFTLDLNCGNGRTILLKDILSSRIINKKFSLTKVYIGDLIGNCYIGSYYGDSTSQSQTFKISTRIDAYVDIDKREYYPSEEVGFELKSVKANGNPVEGFANILFEQANISLTKKVVNGSLITNFSIPNDLAPGTYSIKTEVYERDNQDEITNKVFLENNIRIKQEARRIEIAIESQEAKLEEDYNFKIEVYDQINTSMDVQVRYEIFDNKNNLLFAKLGETNENFAYYITQNDTPGYRTIIASINDVSTQRFFYVPEIEKAEILLTNSTLKIKNIGNVLYKKNVAVEIGGNAEVIEVEMEVGESALYGLHAPEGTYNVKVTDGLDKVSAQGISLTGNSIKITEGLGSSGESLLNRYPLVWVFIIGVLGLFVFGIARSVSKGKFSIRRKEGSSSGKVEVMKTSSAAVPATATVTKSEDQGIKVSKNITEAEHALVLKGQKEEATIISLKIKNRSKIRKSSQCLSTIKEVMEEINEYKGVIYAIEEYVFGIFTPSITRTFKNEIPAIRSAQEAQKILEDHNKKFTDKIDFGIGINTGNLIVKTSPDTSKLRFTSLGTTVSLAKKVSEAADSKVLLSEPAHKKTMSTVKTEKATINNLNVFSIKNITERDQHKKFINDFLKRL